MPSRRSQRCTLNQAGLPVCGLQWVALTTAYNILSPATEPGIALVGQPKTAINEASDNDSRPLASKAAIAALRTGWNETCGTTEVLTEKVNKEKRQESMQPACQLGWQHGSACIYHHIGKRLLQSPSMTGLGNCRQLRPWDRCSQYAFLALFLLHLLSQHFSCASHLSPPHAQCCNDSLGYQRGGNSGRGYLDACLELVAEGAATLGKRRQDVVGTCQGHRCLSP